MAIPDLDVNYGLSGTVEEAETDAVAAARSYTDSAVTLVKRAHDPRAYGLTGGADDSAALQACFDAAGAHGTVELPEKLTINTRSTLTLPDGLELRGAGAKGAVIATDRDIAVVSNIGGEGNALRNFKIANSWVGARTTYDIELVNPFRPLVRDVEIALGQSATGKGGIHISKATGQLNDDKCFMPVLDNVWVRNGSMLIENVTDGKVIGGWVWATYTGAAGAVELKGASNWTFENLDVVPSTNAGYLVSGGLNLLTIIGGMIDGSYDTIQTGWGVQSTDYIRGLSVLGLKLYNIWLGGFNLYDVRDGSVANCQFTQNNKSDSSVPEIQLSACQALSFIGNGFRAPVLRNNPGLIVTEDSQCSDNEYRQNTLEINSAIVPNGHYYNTALMSVQDSASVGDNLPRSNWPLFRPIQSKSSNYTATKNDLFSKRIIYQSGTTTFTLPSASSIHTGDEIMVKNTGTGVVTVATTSSQTIEGLYTTLNLYPKQALRLQSDGSGWQVISDANRFPLAPQAKSGQWQGASNMGGLSATALSGTSGQASWCYVDIEKPTTLARLGIHVNVAAVGGATLECRLGWFADDGSGSYPGVTVVDGGAADLTSTGTQQGSALTTAVAPGRYWAAMKWTFGTVPTTLPQVAMISLAGIPLPGSNLGNNYRGYATTGLTAGAFSGSAPAGMSASGATAVANVGYKAT